jgi:hypothetical protein
MYGIVKKVTGMNLRSVEEGQERRSSIPGICFLLASILGHISPRGEMRFISLDQKLSWFNNAGHTCTYAKKGGSQPSVREDFYATRQRHTIFTTVPSWGHGDPNMPPKICVLLKAQPGGTILNDLRKSDLVKPGVHVQVQ